MSLWDYVLPWKAVPNMIADVKEAGGGSKDGKDGKRQRNHGSVVGAIGKYADPAGALLGDSWMDFWHERLPEQMNRWTSGIAQKDPMIQADRKWGLGQKGSPLRGVSNFAEDRPADTAAIVLGSIFGGGALLGGAGAGAGGGGAAGGGLTTGSAAGGSGGGFGTAVGSGGGGGGWGGLGFSGVNWSDPNTYMQLAGNMPSMGQQQQPTQQVAPAQPRQPLAISTATSAGPSPDLHTVLARLARTGRVRQA